MKSDQALIRKGLRVAHSDIYDENEIWMRYSNDKVDIGISAPHALIAFAGSQTGVQIKRLPQMHVYTSKACADRCSDRCF